MTKQVFCFCVFILCCVSLRVDALDSLVLQSIVSEQEYYQISSIEDIWHVKQTNEGIEVLFLTEHQDRYPNASVVLTKQELNEFLKEEFNRNQIHKEWNANEPLEDFFNAFRTYDEIMSFCDTLALKYPSLVTKFEAGTTWEGAVIYGFIVSTSNGDSNKPRVWLQAQQHAREWLATPTLLYTYYTLLEESSTNSTYSNMLNNIDWHIIPMVNIDGYKYTWFNESTRLWRKNRHVLESGAIGVDLNRNWGPVNTWCTAGSSVIPSADTYCGTSVFSEPETRTIAEKIGSIINMKGGIDFHTYGPLLLWPWQYTIDKVSPLNYTEFSVLGQKMVTAVNNVHGENFISQQGSDLYEHSGGFIDYNYERHEMITFTYELRGDHFIVPPEYILPSGQEALAGVVIFAEHIINS